ncbi:MAG: hypothetical protein EAZ08_09095 [Cytophagales bacterium]|nr:MAG: hypothetical protein EAZ08_09095 [Cytophagales bacterium]
MAGNSTQTDITKSFVLRLDFDAETELDKIVAQLGSNQTQAVRHIIKNFRLCPKRYQKAEQ